jgi:uncharacterized protein (DUF1778 family)
VCSRFERVTLSAGYRVENPKAGKVFSIPPTFVLQCSIRGCMIKNPQRSIPMQLTQSKEAVSINIRAKAKQRDLIDQAADRLGRSRSDFMLEAACREAENVLLDQTFFTVDQGTFAKFQALLDNPLTPTDKLRRLLKTKAPWE